MSKEQESRVRLITTDQPTEWLKQKKKSTAVKAHLSIGMYVYVLCSVYSRQTLFAII